MESFCIYKRRFEVILQHILVTLNGEIEADNGICILENFNYSKFMLDIKLRQNIPSQREGLECVIHEEEEKDKPQINTELRGIYTHDNLLVIIVQNLKLKELIALKLSAVHTYFPSSFNSDKGGFHCS